MLPRRSRRWLSILLILLALAAGCAPRGPAGGGPADGRSGSGPGAPGGAPRTLTVAAASDLYHAFAEIGQLYTERTGVEVTFTFGASGNLASQIENGAPVDLFAAADVSYVDQLIEAGALIPETRRVYALGHLVLAASTRAGTEADELTDLLDPAVGYIAIANPNHAPYGRAAREALESAGLWEALQPKLVLAENARQALQYVQTGNADAGLVPHSLAGVPEITCVPVDPSLHSPLEQALAVVAGSPLADEARRFADLVTGPEGRAVLERYGFGLPAE